MDIFLFIIKFLDQSARSVSDDACVKLGLRNNIISLSGGRGGGTRILSRNLGNWEFWAWPLFFSGGHFTDLQGGGESLSFQLFCHREMH
jgi:hypothetical protein